MSRRRPAVAAGTLLALAMARPLLAAWDVPGGGAAAATAVALGTPAAVATSQVTATGMTLSWRAPVIGPAPDAYVISRNGAVITTCKADGPTSCTDSGLSAGTAYTYTVSAALRSWQGPSSAPVTRSTSASAPVDTTPPTITSLTRADVNPTAAGSVTWTATFSEPVTGVGNADFALAPGLTGAQVTGVSGTGTTYVVTASTGTGSGMLGLDLLDDDSIQDAARNPLAGTTSGAFTGQVYTLVRTPLTVTIDQKAGQLDPTRVASSRWTVTFDRAVTGFDVADLIRTTGTGGTLSVSGSGASYEVLLDGAPVEGTHALTVRAGAAVDSTDVTRASGASTSADNTIVYDITAPTILSAAAVAGNSDQEAFSGTSTEGGGSVQVTVLDATTGAFVRAYLASVPTTQSGGGYVWTVDTSPNDLSPSTSYRYSAIHTDLAGNASAVLAGGTFSGS